MMRRMHARGGMLLLAALLALAGTSLSATPRLPAYTLSPFRAVLQTDFGDIHLAFYHEV